MKNAYVTVPEGPHYRRDAFAAGLEACGFRVTFGRAAHARPAEIFAGDLLVTWNLHRGEESLAPEYRRRGGLVMVAENGYIGADADGRQLYSLALDGHNGSGRWPVTPGRWQQLGIDTPGRVDLDRPGYVLIAAQRGIGGSIMRSPANWIPRAKHLAGKRFPGREIRIRHHPGRHQPERPLEQDIDGAAWVLIWSSGVGVHALARGVPVLYDAPHWIGETAACRADITTPPRDAIDVAAYQTALDRIASGQWSLAEIAAGVAFRALLDHDRDQPLCRDPQPAQA